MSSESGCSVRSPRSVGVRSMDQSTHDVPEMLAKYFSSMSRLRESVPGMRRGLDGDFED